MDSLELDLPEGRDLMVLDVLELLKARGSLDCLSPVVPRGCVRIGWHQHERQERPGVHHTGLGGRAAGQADATATPGTARGPGPGGGHEPVLPSIREDRAVARQRHCATGPGTAAVPRGSGKAQRSLRVHPVRLLLHRVSVVLVESGQVRRPRGPLCRPTGSSPTAATLRPRSGSRP